MKVEEIGFGRVKIDGKEYTEDFIVSKGKIEKRKKENSRKYKAKYGHTPLTIEENIPWNCKTLVIGKGFYNALPIEKSIIDEASKRGTKVVILNTPEALSLLEQSNLNNTNFIIHLTC